MRFAPGHPQAQRRGHWRQRLFASSLAIVVHTAYHLGEIRQAIGVLA